MMSDRSMRGTRLGAQSMESEAGVQPAARQNVTYQCPNGHTFEVPMSVAAAEQVVQSLVGNGYDDVDFAALLEYEAKASGLDLEPEDVEVSDGLAEASTNGDRPATARTAA